MATSETKIVFLDTETTGLDSDRHEIWEIGAIVRTDEADIEYCWQIYLVLSEEERAKGFVRPLRASYWHTACGKVTTMGQAIAQTYARNPTFYGGTYCAHCRMHRPVGADGEFHWVDPAHPERQSSTLDPKVGT